MEPLKIIKELGIEKINSGYRKKFCIAQCGCGKKFKTTVNAIKSLNTKSCGCLFHRRHIKSIVKDPAYNLWKDIKKRCYNRNTEFYHLYGGRGIKVCEEWKNNSKEFCSWAHQNGFHKGLYIDRINPELNYSPDNCRFVNSFVSAQNTRLISSTNKSGFRGVSKHLDIKGNIKWRARITNLNKKISLGVYETKIQAAQAYDNYVLKYKTNHPLNFNNN